MPGVLRIKAPPAGPMFAEIRKAVEQPTADGRGELLAWRLRNGPGSTKDQAARQVSMSDQGNNPWEPTKAFGSRPATRPTLHDTGSYLAAWHGEGAGAITDITANGVSITVDPVRFSQRNVFQGTSPTVQRATPKQRFYLGMTDGVWMKPGATITNEPRPLRMNPTLRAGCQAALVKAIATGNAQAARSFA